MRMRSRTIVAAFGLLAAVSSAVQAQVVASDATLVERSTLGKGAVQNNERAGEITEVSHSTDCNFDAYSNYDMMRATDQRSLGHRLRDKWGLSPRQGDSSYCDFECANCWWKLDFEKRFIMTYARVGPQQPATLLGYGEGDGAQVGVELLPFILRDSPNQYSRWGALLMFNYVHYNGFEYGVLQSKLSGRVLRVTGGDQYGIIAGPTFRTDFDFFGLRLSPNASAGLSFEWASMKDAQPNPHAYRIRRVDSFEFSGFDVGGYGRLMLDFGVTDYMNLSVGMDFRATPSTVMLANDDYRKFISLVVGIGYEF